jgi:glycosyltransferase involved in cell wall biosynthesis
MARDAERPNIEACNVAHGPRADRPLRVLRVIARMNVGGPAYHVSLLSGGLRRDRFQTLLVTGQIGSDEASYEDLADRYGAERHLVPALGPTLDPLSDLRALAGLARVARRFNPDILHTHTAKAGLLGRLAASAVGPRRPIVLHTYHGHVLEGYFGKLQSEAYRRLERRLARRSDALIGVSQATVDDLVRLGVAPREKFRVVPLGLDLDRFLRIGASPSPHARAAIGVDTEAVLVVYVGRLVPIKRVDRLVEALAIARRQDRRLVLAIVGDGGERSALEQLVRTNGLADAVRFLGYRRDLETIVDAGDIAALGSDNEGTPVALIEAGAAARPLVSTRVGGVPEVVVPGTGLLVKRDDVAGLAHALVDLAADPERRRAMGARARTHVSAQYDATTLLERIAGLYEELVSMRSVTAGTDAGGSPRRRAGARTSR